MQWGNAMQHELLSNGIGYQLAVHTVTTRSGANNTVGRADLLRYRHTCVQQHDDKQRML